MKRVIYLLAAYLVAFSGFSYAAKVYVWTDKNGNKVFSQRPPPSKAVPHKKKEYKSDTASDGTSGSGQPACMRKLRYTYRNINNNYRSGLKRCNALGNRSRTHISEWRSNCMYNVRNKRTRSMRDYNRKSRECRRAAYARSRAKNRVSDRGSSKTCKEKSADMQKTIKLMRRRHERQCDAMLRSSGSVSYKHCMNKARKKYNFSMSRHIDYVNSGCRR